MSDSGFQGLNEDLLISLARELTDTAAVFREVRNSNSSVVINAGGLTAAVAVCVSLTSVLCMLLLGFLLMWQQAEQKSQQEAWIQVWQQRVANELRKE
jgi:hypothetical protein